MQHRSVVVLAFLILSLVTIGTLQAKPTDPVPKGKVPFIQEAQVDFDVAVECPDSGTIASDTLTITGIGLGLSDGPSPVINLGTYPPLTVCVFDEELVVAELPTGTEDGDYLLSVITSDGVGTFDLTIGAIGPQGPIGSVGPVGPAGSNGSDGADGEDGADGTDGDEGPIGPVGPQGPKGDNGDQGLTGADGDQGPVGPAGANGIDGTNGASCSITECLDPGEATLTCGAASVTVPCILPTGYAIGDTGPAGGIVFYVTDGGLHGLEAANFDQASAPWGCVDTFLSDANGTAIGTGAQNTAAILAGCLEVGIAARIADSHSQGGFNDWFLPSKDELNELYIQKDVVGNFAFDLYWSSYAGRPALSWGQHFGFGNGYGEDNYKTFRVRAIRTF